MKFNPEMFNTNPWYPNESNPYTDETLKQLYKAGDGMLNGLNLTAFPRSNRNLYPLDLFEIQALSELDPSTGWSTNTLLSDDYQNLANEFDYNMAISDPIDHQGLRDFYAKKARDMLLKNPFENGKPNAFTDMSDFVFDTTGRYA